MEKSIELVDYSKSHDSSLLLNCIEIISVVDITILDQPVVLGTLEMHIKRWFLLQGDFNLNQQQVERDRSGFCHTIGQAWHSHRSLCFKPLTWDFSFQKRNCFNPIINVLVYMHSSYNLFLWNTKHQRSPQGIAILEKIHYLKLLRKIWCCNW